MFYFLLGLISEPNREYQLQCFRRRDPNVQQKDLVILRRDLLYEEGINFESNKIKCGLVGVENVGKTCFINSILQCLFNTLKLSKDLLETHNWKKQINPFSESRGRLICKYFKLLKQVWESNQCFICPDEFFKALLKSEQFRTIIK